MRSRDGDSEDTSSRAEITASRIKLRGRRSKLRTPRIPSNVRIEDVPEDILIVVCFCSAVQLSLQ
jgi:hypothetical protein